MSLWFLMQNVSLTSHKIHDFRSMWLDYHSTLLDVEILNSNFSSITERLANEVNSQYEVQRNIDASKGGNHLTQSDRNNITNDHINNYDFFFFFLSSPAYWHARKVTWMNPSTECQPALVLFLAWRGWNSQSHLCDWHQYSPVSHAPPPHREAPGPLNPWSLPTMPKSTTSTLKSHVL